MTKRQQARAKKPVQKASRITAPWLGQLMLVTLIVAGLAGAGYWLGQSDNFPVKNVHIQEKLKYVQKDELRTVIARHMQEGFLGMDVTAMREAIEAQPWVKHCSVRRSWPSTVVLSITEQEAMARWGDSGLVNTEGQYFQPSSSSIPGGLAELSGPKGTTVAVTAHYRALQNSLSPLGLSISTLSLDSRRAWRMELDNGIKVMLGRNASESRMKRFIQVYPKLLAPQLDAVARVDLRYTNGFAVAWNEASGLSRDMYRNLSMDKSLETPSASFRG